MYKVYDDILDELREPFGQVYTTPPPVMEGNRVIAVGDVTTDILIDNGNIPWISIIDFKNKREPVDTDNSKSLKTYGENFISIKNPAGNITSELWDMISLRIDESEPFQIRVDGEEDLATLPAIFLSPPGTFVAYGLPDKGMVVVDVNEENKYNVKNLLKKMEV